MKLKLAKYFLIFLMALILFGCNNGNKLTIKLYFDLNSEPEEVLVNKGHLLEEPSSPTKEDNEFLGWFYDEELTNSVTWPLTLTGDTNLYAKWKYYTVTWTNYDGSILEEDRVLFGETATYDGETPTKPLIGEIGYIFKEFTINDIALVNKDITSTALFDEVRIKIYDLYLSAKQGNTDAFYILLNLYENYGSDESLAVLTLVDPTNLSELAEDGERDAYYYLTRISELGNGLAIQKLANFDISKFIDKANSGDVRAFNFLFDFYQENEIDGYETFNQMEVQAFLDNEQDFGTAYQIVVTLGIVYNNQKAIIALEKSITDSVLIETYYIFGKSILNDYNVEDLIELVDVEGLKESYDGSSREYELLLKYLIIYGKNEAYEALIDYSYTSSSGVEILIELLTPENSDIIISDLKEIALSGNDKAMQFFVGQAYNEQNEFYDESLIVLIELATNGDYQAINSLSQSGNEGLLTDLSVENIVNYIRNSDESETDKYFDVLRELHDDYNNPNAYKGILDLIAEGNQQAYQFLLGRYDYDSFELYLADYLFSLIDNEDNLYLLKFYFQLIKEGFDFFQTIEGTQFVSCYDKYISLMDNEEDFQFITEQINSIGDMSVILNAINEGNKYALKLLARYGFYESGLNQEEYNINYDSLIALAEAGDSEILYIFVMYYQDILFPENELAVINVSGYYDQILNGDISSIDEITILSSYYDNPYANNICNSLRNDGIGSLLNKILLSGTEQDYIDIFWVGDLTYLFDIEVINNSMSNLDLTVLFNRIGNGDIEAYELYIVMSEEYDILMSDMISSVDISSLIGKIENGDFRLYALLYDLALEKGYLAAFNILNTLQIPEFSDSYYNENRYDNFIIDSLYDLAVYYNNLSALESLARWSFKDLAARSRILLILEMSYDYNLADELYNIMTSENLLVLGYSRIETYKNMILSGNQLVLDIVCDMLVKGDSGARDLMSSLVNLEYQPAIDKVIEIAESGSDYALQILEHYNLIDTLAELDVSIYITVIEQAGKDWVLLLSMLAKLAIDYGNPNAIFGLTNLNPTLIINIDLDDTMVSYGGLNYFIVFDNQIAIDLYWTYVSEGNEDAKDILFHISANNNSNLSQYMDEIINYANQNCNFAINYLFFLAYEGNNEAYQAILDLIDNNNEMAVFNIFHSYEYEEVIISLIEDSNILALKNLLDFDYPFISTSVRELLVENGYID